MESDRTRVQSWDPLGALAAARGQLMPWVPICMSCGIGSWFLLHSEPGAMIYGLVAGLMLMSGLLWRIGPETLRAPGAAVALILFGFLLMGARGHSVAAPVLEFRYYGAVEGRIVSIDRSFSDRLRLTLDQVVMERMAPEKTPKLVRIAMHGEQGFIDPVPGLRVILTAHVSPPEGPVEPGGFDFQRLAWFTQLGGVGYTRSPVLTLAPAQEGRAGLFVHRLRTDMANKIRAQLPGEAGALAAALATGDRSGLSRETTENLRASNLSHLLAISGLHMGLLTGFVFAMLRYGLALIPPLALRIPVKKVAALVALCAAAFYLALSGGNVATKRAFIMVAVMLVAVLLDRRAISLRSVALAAVLILLIEPESLVEPGFQMSFAATTALIAAFQVLAPRLKGLPPLVAPVVGLLLSSAIAGAATAPIAAAHFNRIAEYGLLANMLSMPLMGTIVMPAAVVAAVLAPFGAAYPALWVMHLGTGWILMVAEWVSGMNGAVLPVPAPPGPALPIMAFGALVVILVRVWPVRLLGAVLGFAALALWTMTDRPAMLVSGDGGLIGVMTDEGRALSKPKGAGFVAQSWLEDDGDLAEQAVAFERPGLSGEKGALFTELGPVSVFHFTGKGADDAAGAACRDNAMIILTAEFDPGEGPCTVFDKYRLRETGALAIYLRPEGPKIVSATETAGRRLWNTKALRLAKIRAAAKP